MLDYIVLYFQLMACICRDMTTERPNHLEGNNFYFSPIDINSHKTQCKWLAWLINPDDHPPRDGWSDDQLTTRWPAERWVVIWHIADKQQTNKQHWLKLLISQCILWTAKCTKHVQCNGITVAAIVTLEIRIIQPHCSGIGTGNNKYAICITYGSCRAPTCW